MLISFIVPAHNEELLLGSTLAALTHSASDLGAPFEIIVIDDASTDETARVARQHDASVVPVSLRQIGAVRNAGAKAARGDVLVFIDADTVLPPRTLRAALRAIENNAVGGGALVVFDQPTAFWARAMVSGWNLLSRLNGWAAGCMIFVRKDAFERVGGFDPAYFAGEELILSTALKKQGRFVIVSQPVITSCRKVKAYSLWATLRVFARLLLGGRKAWQRREGLEMWYKSREEEVSG